MKQLITLIAVMLSIGAFAQERVVVNSKDISINASEAILVRNSETPDIVEVKFQVPMAQQVCQAYSTRVVIVTSASQCGYQERVTGYTTRTICTRTNPINGQCLRTETQRLPIVQRYARSCPVSESYCSSYGTVTNYESDKVRIKFKKLPSLGGTEEDTFSVKARQRSYDGENVVYDITPIQTVVPYNVVKKGILGYDSYVIEVK
jgi:hypothetical protein